MRFLKQKITIHVSFKNTGEKGRNFGSNNTAKREKTFKKLQRYFKYAQCKFQNITTIALIGSQSSNNPHDCKGNP